MCILLKLHYAKFGVSNLFFSKVIEEKPLGDRLGKGRVKNDAIKAVLLNEYTFLIHLIESINDIFHSKGV